MQRRKWLEAAMGAAAAETAATKAAESTSKSAGEASETAAPVATMRYAADIWGTGAAAMSTAVLAVDSIQDDGEDDGDNDETDEAPEGIAALSAFVGVVAVLATADGFDDIEGIGKGTIVVAGGERIDHNVVDDAATEGVGEGAFEAIAG